MYARVTQCYSFQWQGIELSDPGKTLSRPVLLTKPISSGPYPSACPLLHEALLLCCITLLFRASQLSCSTPEVAEFQLWLWTTIRLNPLLLLCGQEAHGTDLTVFYHVSFNPKAITQYPCSSRTLATMFPLLLVVVLRKSYGCVRAHCVIIVII